MKVNLTLSGSIWLCQSQFDSVKVNLTLSKSIWLCQGQFDSVKVNLTLSKSIWLCQGRFDSLTLSKSIWHCQGQFDSVKVKVRVNLLCWRQRFPQIDHCWNYQFWSVSIYQDSGALLSSLLRIESVSLGSSMIGGLRILHWYSNTIIPFICQLLLSTKLSRAKCWSSSL